MFQSVVALQRNAENLQWVTTCKDLQGRCYTWSKRTICKIGIMLNKLINNENQLYILTEEMLRKYGKNLISEVRAELEAEFQKKQNEKYLSPDEVAKMIDVDKSSLWRWEKRGYLIPCRIGCKVRYRLSDIENLMNGGK